MICASRAPLHRAGHNGDAAHAQLRQPQRQRQAERVIDIVADVGVDQHRLDWFMPHASPVRTLKVRRLER